jgi:DNA-binding NarL/FixJ family response regulator
MKERIEETIIMRREFHPRGRKRRHKKTLKYYPKVMFKKQSISQNKRDVIFKLYHAGWKMNWIAKKLKLDPHTVKCHLDEKYRKKRLELSSRRMKRILADPIERRKQFARVDACRKERRKKDSRYRKWVRSVTRKAGSKYDEKNREKRRKKALERHRKKTNRHISTNIDN